MYMNDRENKILSLNTKMDKHSELCCKGLLCPSG